MTQNKIIKYFSYVPTVTSPSHQPSNNHGNILFASTAYNACPIIHPHTSTNFPTGQSLFNRNCVSQQDISHDQLNATHQNTQRSHPLQSINKNTNKSHFRETSTLQSHMPIEHLTSYGTFSEYDSRHTPQANTTIQINSSSQNNHHISILAPNTTTTTMSMVRSPDTLPSINQTRNQNNNISQYPQATQHTCHNPAHGTSLSASNNSTTRQIPANNLTLNTPIHKHSPVDITNFIGTPPSDVKPPNTFCIYYMNPNVLNISLNNQCIFQDHCNKLLHLQANLCAFAETNLDSTKHLVKKILHT